LLDVHAVLVIIMKWWLLVAASSCALSAVVAADAQTAKPSVEVDLCDTGMDRIPLKEGDRHCPNGHKVRRTLLIPGNVNMTPHQKGADGRTYDTWGIFLSVLLTDHGLKFQPSSLKRSEIEADTILLHAGWTGLFDFELKRSVEALSGRTWSDAPRRKLVYTWNDDSDPDFRIFEARENTEETGLVPLLLPRLLVPKSGDRIFFQCMGPALYKGKPLDPSCAVHDFADPEGDQLKYQLRYSRLKDWRRYSTWLWNFVSSLTIRENTR
jgi:hypothetical protein